LARGKAPFEVQPDNRNSNLDLLLPNIKMACRFTPIAFFCSFSVFRFGVFGSKLSNWNLTCQSINASSVSVFFVDPNSNESDLYYVQLSTPENPNYPFAIVTTKSSPVSIGGLAENTTYSFSVRSHNASTPSIAWGPSWAEATDLVECSTPLQNIDPALDVNASSISPNLIAGKNSSFLRVFRISEYSFDVDFLENHDAASMNAMPLYLMSCDPSGNCAPWSVNDLTSRWSECQSFLSMNTSCTRGASFDCVNCLNQERANVTAACGEWSIQDTLEGEGSYSVHW
jgi:hypothetical protein